jgi:hypothetical protein
LVLVLVLVLVLALVLVLVWCGCCRGAHLGERGFGKSLALTLHSCRSPRNAQAGQGQVDGATVPCP